MYPFKKKTVLHVKHKEQLYYKQMVLSLDVTPTIMAQTFNKLFMYNFKYTSALLFYIMFSALAVSQS